MLNGSRLVEGRLPLAVEVDGGSSRRVLVCGCLELVMTGATVVVVVVQLLLLRLLLLP